MIVPVILSGGSGTRLWPLSTSERPKQFLPLTGEESLFRETLARVADRATFAPPIIVANAAHEELSERELADVDGATLLLEPCARNTAVAIAMAAQHAVAAYGPEVPLLVMPSDHVIGNLDRFHAAVRVGLQAAEAGKLVTFGIQPTGPETGYGYLEAGGMVDGMAGVLAVRRFTEKPDRATAADMLARGNFYWNGGIFLFRADILLEETRKHAPEIAAAAAEAVRQARTEHHRVHPPVEALQQCPKLSIDYAVMEKSELVVTVPLDAAWSDVGSWDALAELISSSPDDLITAVKSNNCYVRSDGLKVGLLGVEDLLVIAVDDRVLIMRKGHSQDVRELAPKALVDAN